MDEDDALMDERGTDPPTAQFPRPTAPDGAVSVDMSCGSRKLSLLWDVFTSDFPNWICNLENICAFCFQNFS